MNVTANEFFLSYPANGTASGFARTLVRVFAGEEGPVVLATQLSELDNPGPKIHESVGSLIEALRTRAIDGFRLIAHLNGRSFDAAGSDRIACEPSFTLFDWRADGGAVRIDGHRPLDLDEVARLTGAPADLVRKL